ncbi:hypothetical protein KQX54_005497 [Cotesia glomerata]|uniref:Uncharacterized protein n=1 Tax=Cotesia glomerata TaxID=32391 RepID=A0AAV7HUZ9_COTGL|nr:hypothetical protein KQX54_005497 [Cotesia glomerata]
MILGSSEESRPGTGDPGKLGVKKPRPKPSSPNRQGPQQCQGFSNKRFICLLLPSEAPEAIEDDAGMKMTILFKESRADYDDDGNHNCGEKREDCNKASFLVLPRSTIELNIPFPKRTNT